MYSYCHWLWQPLSSSIVAEMTNRAEERRILVRRRRQMRPYRQIRFTYFQQSQRQSPRLNSQPISMGILEWAALPNHVKGNSEEPRAGGTILEQVGGLLIPQARMLTATSAIVFNSASHPEEQTACRQLPPTGWNMVLMYQWIWMRTTALSLLTMPAIWI